MKITEESFYNISNMVKLNLTEEEKLKLMKDLNQVIEFIGTINELDTDDEVPMAYIHSLKNIYRDDVATDSKAGQELHANAPESKNGFYVAPRIFNE